MVKTQKLNFQLFRFKMTFVKFMTVSRRGLLKGLFSISFQEGTVKGTVLNQFPGRGLLKGLFSISFQEGDC